MTEDAQADPNPVPRKAPDVFVSYSRTDQPMVRRLYETLRDQGREVWVDWDAIHPSAEWFAEIERGIRSTNVLIFVISPESVASEICRRELDLAVQLNKRLVPVVCRDTRPEDVQQELRKRNWVFLRGQDDFDAGLESLTQALDVDIDWLHRHTEQLTQALSWTDAGRDRSRLLKGRTLQEAEAWVAEGPNKDPAPAAVQLEFIQASRSAATSRLRRLVAGTLVGLLVTLVLAAWALFASYAAQVARDEAVARRLGAEASLVASERDSLIERSALLAIESWRRGPSLLNDVPLRRALPLLPVPVAGWGHWSLPVDAAVLIEPGDGVAYAAGKEVFVAHTSDPGNAQQLPHASSVKQLASCAGGKVLASRTAQGRVFLWNVQTLALIRLLPGRQKASQLRCSAGGELVAVGWRNGQVSLHRAIDGSLIKDLPSPLGSPVRSLAFSKSRNEIAAGGDGMLRIWNTGSGEVSASIEHSHPVVDIGFDPGGLRIASASGPWAYLWSLPQAALIKRLQHPTNVHAIAFGNTGRRLATGCGDYKAYVWDASSFRRIGRLPHQGPVKGVKFSTDDDLILTASNDDTARLWTAGTGREVLRFAHNRVVAPIGATDFVVAADFDAAGERILTAGRDGRVRVWNSTPAGEQRHMAKTRFVNGRRWSSAGGFLIEKVGDTQWSLRESVSGRSVLEFASDSGILAFAMGPAGKRVAISTFAGEIRVMKIADGALLQSIKLPAVADTISFHPVQQRLLSGSRDMLVRYWSLEDGRLLWEKRHGGMVMTSDFSANGELVATGGTNSVAMVWRATDGMQMHSLRHIHDVKDLAFDPPGQALATACSDGTARIWNLGSEKVLRHLQHQFPVEAVAFSPGGELLLTGSSDNTVRIWNAESGLEQSRTKTTHAVQRVGFLPGGRFLVATGRGVGTHAVHGEDLVNAACARLTRNLSRIEWLQYVGAEAPRATCPGLPLSMSALHAGAG